MNTRAMSIIVGILIFAASPLFGADDVSLNGGLGNVLCAAVCGSCCTGTTLMEKNNGFEAAVNRSDVDLTEYIDDGKNHGITGYFETGQGSCDEGDCVYFHVTSVGETADASFDSATGTLHIPNLVIDGTLNYTVDLGPPFNLISAAPVGSFVIVRQGGDCSAENAVCADTTTCVEYYGIAGGSGPLFKTCEIPCESDLQCPSGQQCTLIADGPGYVCQPGETTE